MFNFVQIRPLIKTNYILFAYLLNFENVYTNGELFIFRIDKN